MISRTRDPAMRGRPRSLRVAAVLFAGAALFLWFRSIDAPRTALAEVPPAPGRAGRSSLQSATPEAPRPSEEVPWPTSWSRDPFTRLFKEPTPVPPPLLSAAPSPTPTPAPTKETPSQFRVGAILYGTTPVALINGVICKEGDVIGGHRVQRIERESVVLEIQGTTLVLTP